MRHTNTDLRNRPPQYARWSQTADDSARLAAGYARTAKGTAEFYRGNAQSSDARGDYAIAELYGRMADAAEDAAAAYDEQVEAATELAGLLAEKAATLGTVRRSDRGYGE
jgi:hypothetical protein